MSQTRILLDLTFAGLSPLVAGDRLRTMSNIERLIRGLKHGSHQRAIGGAANTCKTTPTIVAASGTVTITQATPVTVGQTLTIAGSALTAQQSRARSTLTCVSAIAGDTVIVNGVTFTGTAGAVTLGDATFSIDTSDTATATSIAAQVNAYVSPLLTGLTCPFTAAGVVTVCANIEGTQGNVITLTTTGGTITATGSGFLAGGAAIANDKFDFGSGTTNVTASLNRAINASTTANIKKVTAAITSAGVITMTAVLGGVGGNAITLTSASGTTLAVTGSGFLTSGSQGATTVLTF